MTQVGKPKHRRNQRKDCKTCSRKYLNQFVVDSLKPKAMGIVKKWIGNILHNHLHMKKVCACWLSIMLMPLDNQRRITSSEEFFDTCGDNPDMFCLVISLLIKYGFDSTISSQNESMH